MEEIIALVTLLHMPKLGAVRIRQLVDYFGGAIEALKAKPEEIKTVPRFGAQLAASWQPEKYKPQAIKDLEFANQLNVNVITFRDALYPQSLLNIPDFPPILYVKGTLLPQDESSLAVVGTRFCSIYGKEMAFKLSQGLASNGFTIISGLARGIDTEAHEGALTGGRTIAVIGSGLSKIYPKENERLAARIAENGAIISEFPMATPPNKENFPKRNRIVSGMGLGTLLIEAPEKSGAMITATIALSQEKPLFALPGRADSSTFEGNLALIQSGKAKLVRGAEDILNYFEIGRSKPISTINKISLIDLDADEKKFLKYFPSEEISIDELSQKTNLPIHQINVLLISLLLKAVIKEYPGKLYKKK